MPDLHIHYSQDDAGLVPMIVNYADSLCEIVAKALEKDPGEIALFPHPREEQVELISRNLNRLEIIVEAGMDQPPDTPKEISNNILEKIRSLDGMNKISIGVGVRIFGSSTNGFSEHEGDD